jgi:purine-binding chemotaxis protein CheW
MTANPQTRDSSTANSESERSIASDQPAEFVTFTLGAEEYGVDIMRVREIRGWAGSTPIPHAPTHVRGVINLRGDIVPIFDLRSRFGTGTTETSKTHVIIIVNTGSETVGLLADTVSDIISVERKAIRPIPESASGDQERILEGLVILEGRMVTLVSLAGLTGHRVDAVAATEMQAA